MTARSSSWRDVLAELRAGGEFMPHSRFALRSLADARRALDALEGELVLRARRDGVTWREAAADLGVSRTTLQARLARRTRAGRGFATPPTGE